MGLDIQFARTEYDYGFRAGSYSGFNLFRTALALEEGIVLDEMEGFGGTVAWSDRATTLMPFLYHSDCDGIINHYDAEDMLPRFREIAQKWSGGDFAEKAIEDETKTYYVELINHWVEAFERIVEAYEDEIDEHIVFS